MKKFFLVAVLSTSAPALYAQSIAAGTVAVGGNVGYSQTNNKNSGGNSSNSNQNNSFSSENKGWQFSAFPTVSYFVADNLAIGLSVGYVYGKRTEDAVSVPALYTVQHSLSRMSSLQAGAFAQYYKMLTTQFGLTGRLGGGYQRFKDDRDGNYLVIGTPYYFNSSNTSQGYYLNFMPGLIFFPVPKFGLTASMGSLSFNHFSLTNYSYNDSSNTPYSNNSDTDGNSFSANFGLDAFQLGGTYYFGR
jgi:hypothetical protein